MFSLHMRMTVLVVVGLVLLHQPQVPLAKIPTHPAHTRHHHSGGGGGGGGGGGSSSSSNSDRVPSNTPSSDVSTISDDDDAVDDHDSLLQSEKAKHYYHLHYRQRARDREVAHSIRGILASFQAPAPPADNSRGPRATTKPSTAPTHRSHRDQQQRRPLSRPSSSTSSSLSEDTPTSTPTSPPASRSTSTSTSASAATTIATSASPTTSTSTAASSSVPAGPGSVEHAHRKSAAHSVSARSGTKSASSAAGYSAESKSDVKHNPKLAGAPAASAGAARDEYVDDDDDYYEDADDYADDGGDSGDTEVDADADADGAEEDDFNRFAESDGSSLGPVGDNNLSDRSYARITRSRNDPDYADDEPYQSADDELQQHEPPGVLTEQKYYEVGNEKAVQQARDRYIQEQKRPRTPHELATEHWHRMIVATKCRKPMPRVIPISNNTSKRYEPYATILHRCGEDTGCCGSTASVCTVKRYEVVMVYVFSYDFNYRKEIEALPLHNHTECHCVNRGSLLHDSMPRGKRSGHGWRRHDYRNRDRDRDRDEDRAWGWDQDRYHHQQQDNTLNCHCPRHFNVFEEDVERHAHLPRPHSVFTRKCHCDCLLGNTTCLRFKNGEEGFSLDDRRCISEHNCKPPTCSHGDYNSKLGRCPAIRTHNPSSSSSTSTSASASASKRYELGFL